MLSILVAYYSRGGNTEAMAEAVGDGGHMGNPGLKGTAPLLAIR